MRQLKRDRGSRFRLPAACRRGLEHDQPVLGLVLGRAGQGRPHPACGLRKVLGLAPRQDAGSDRLDAVAAGHREPQLGLNRNLDAERRLQRSQQGLVGLLRAGLGEEPCPRRLLVPGDRHG